MTETTPHTIRTGHIGLNVTDLDRSKKFYEQAFGFQVLRESQEPGRAFAFLADGPTLVLTLWQQSRGLFPPAQPGLHHLSFQVDSLAEVQDAEARVRAAGGRFVHDGIVAHAEGASSGGIYFLDPDGIRLEVFAASGAGERPAPSGEAPTCGFF